MFAKLSRWLKRLTDNSPPERSLPDKVRELLAEARVPAALELLIEAGYTDTIALKIRREEALDQYQQKLIDADTFQVTNSRIIYALLNMVEPEESQRKQEEKVSSMEAASKGLPTHFTEDQTKEIRSLLLRNDYQAAMELAKNGSLEGLLLYQRYKQTSRDLRLGLVRQEDHQRTVQQIIHAVTALVSPKETLTALTSEQQTHLHELLAAEQWPELLALGGEWNDHFLLLSTQYHQAETSFSKGLITKGSYEDSMKHIQQEVRKLLEE
jgi:hypothetical protein